MARGTVKFFQKPKGFGFIVPDTGDGDVFVHITAVKAAGLEDLDEGDVISFELDRDSRNGKLSAIDIDLLEKAAHRESRLEIRRFEVDRRSTARVPAGEGAGVVKWFNDAKGFGFIQPDDGGLDIFVHVRDVQRCGLSGLKDGQRVMFELSRDPRSDKVSARTVRLA